MGLVDEFMNEYKYWTETNEDLDHKTVNLLMMKSCICIERYANTMLVMEGCGLTLSKEYCDEYESLLLERLDMCRKLNEFYVEDRKHSCWLFRWLIDRQYHTGIAVAQRNSVSVDAIA